MRFKKRAMSAQRDYARKLKKKEWIPLEDQFENIIIVKMLQKRGCTLSGVLEGLQGCFGDVKTVQLRWGENWSVFFTKKLLLFLL